MFSKDFFAQQLRDILAKQGLSQRQLAIRISVSPQALAQYCNAQNLPSIETLIAIADVLDISLDELVGRKR